MDNPAFLNNFIIARRLRWIDAFIHIVHNFHAHVQIGQQFDCLSATLEMPFKDTIDDPNPHTGWSPERSKHLGGAVLEAIRAVMPELRT